MKRICLFLTVYVACFSVALAQNQPPSLTNHSAFLDLNALYEKDTGTPEFVAIGNALETEFSGVNEDLRSLSKQYGELGNEIERRAKGSGSQTLEELISQLRELELNIRIKQEKAREAYHKRRTEMSSQLMPRIEATLAKYARQNGIVVVYLCSDWREQCLRFPSSRDVTKDFVDFMRKQRSPNT